jgi:hypothetical protein
MSNETFKTATAAVVYQITANLVVAKEFGDRIAYVGALGGEYFIANSEGRDLAYWPTIKASSVDRVELHVRAMAGFLEDGSSVVFSVEGREIPEFRFVVNGGKVEKETPRIVWGSSNKGGNSGNNQGKQNNNNGGNKQNNNNNGGNKEENGQGNN